MQFLVIRQPGAERVLRLDTVPRTSAFSSLCFNSTVVCCLRCVRAVHTISAIAHPPSPRTLAEAKAQLLSYHHEITRLRIAVGLPVDQDPNSSARSVFLVLLLFLLTCTCVGTERLALSPPNSGLSPATLADAITLIRQLLAENESLRAQLAAATQTLQLGSGSSSSTVLPRVASSSVASVKPVQRDVQQQQRTLATMQTPQPLGSASAEQEFAGGMPFHVSLDAAPLSAPSAASTDLPGQLFHQDSALPELPNAVNVSTDASASA